MQTFLPYPDFVRTAQVLDWRRLGKQRLEDQHILDILAGRRAGGRWTHHPAVRVWCGYPDALGAYLNAVIDEWVRRGYRNTRLYYPLPARPLILPPWLGSEAFHASHRAALLAKAPEHYTQFGWVEEPRIAYVWPQPEA